MKMLLVFLLLIITAGISGTIVFLNQERVVLVLTPTFRDVYYIVPPMPLGLLVVLSFFIGLLVGYITGVISKFFK
ncbi:hypothetical protein IAE16_01135 [Hydrogenobacter sp. T-2]|uniref:hypothetical protein n=1 Tax=Pampinifervens diazotrophicum TaxID=1632018 RepID=UPI002B262878|nr:hypothetical protein [Hydrogenobacter sp. T-2]WPM32300.1 hypothetical protein IAE16_01135 [Hydrogenobacter sp. T-2]